MFLHIPFFFIFYFFIFFGDQEFLIKIIFIKKSTVTLFNVNIPTDIFSKRFHYANGHISFSINRTISYL
jgi:hypothetical protein